MKTKIPILISALLTPHGPPTQVFLMTILQLETQLCVSGEIYAEYEEVIRRPPEAHGA